MGAFSFHGTKNISCGEGGALVTNDQQLAKAIAIFRANGTNRNDFLEGLVAKYHWVGSGSSYFLSDLLASIVLVQLGKLKAINAGRAAIAARYTDALSQFREKIQLPVVSDGTSPNWHIYAVKLPTVSGRERFVRAMRDSGIEVSLHYVPLHSSPMGRRVSRFRSLPVTEDVAKTLVRLPIYPDLTMHQCDYISTVARKILKKI
jgi:dTDP-4-amino-4,6-dideoxygalactose transaminase